MAGCHVGITVAGEVDEIHWSSSSQNRSIPGETIEIDHGLWGRRRFGWLAERWLAPRLWFCNDGPWANEAVCGLWTDFADPQAQLRVISVQKPPSPTVAVIVLRVVIPNFFGHRRDSQGCGPGFVGGYIAGWKG